SLLFSLVSFSISPPLSFCHLPLPKRKEKKGRQTAPLATGRFNFVEAHISFARLAKWESHDQKRIQVLLEGSRKYHSPSDRISERIEREPGEASLPRKRRHHTTKTEKETR